MPLCITLCLIAGAGQAQSTHASFTDSITIRLNENASRVLYTNPDSAIILSRQAEERTEKTKDETQQVRALCCLSKAWYIKGTLQQSLKFSTRALSIAEKINDKECMATAYNEIGLVYLGHYQYDLALKEFLKAIDLATIGKDSSHVSSYLFNAGLSYDYSGAYVHALDYLNKALRSDKGQHVALMSINRLGEIWLHLKKYDTAERYYRRVLSDPRAKDDSWEKAFAYQGLAQLVYIRGLYDSAIGLGSQSLYFARRINAKWDAERAIKILADSYAALHQYQKAYEYMMTDRIYNDSLYNDSQEEVANFIKLQQQEKENGQLQSQSEKDSKIIQLRTMLLIVATLLLALLIGVAFIFYRNARIKNRLNKQLQLQNLDILAKKQQIDQQNEALLASNQLKDQMFSVISHDLRSPMAAIQQMLELMKARDLPEQERGKLYDLFYRQVVLNNNMLNNLLHWVSTQLSGPVIISQKEIVDPSLIVSEVLSVYTFLAAQKKISMDNQLRKGVTIQVDKEQLKIIFQNIIGNAVKFTNPGGTIQLFHTLDDGNGRITLHVKDDGVGIPEKKLATLFDQSGPSKSTYGTASEKGTGIGLHLVRQFVEHNNGTITIFSTENKGTETCVSFTCTDPGAAA